MGCSCLNEVRRERPAGVQDTRRLDAERRRSLERNRLGRQLAVARVAGRRLPVGRQRRSPRLLARGELAPGEVASQRERETRGAELGAVQTVLGDKPIGPPLRRLDAVADGLDHAADVDPGLLGLLQRRIALPGGGRTRCGPELTGAGERDRDECGNGRK